MPALIEIKQTNIKGIEQFWFSPIKHCLIEFMPGLSYNYILYAIYGSYDEKVLIGSYNTKKEVEIKIIELMSNSTLIVKK